MSCHADCYLVILLLLISFMSCSVFFFFFNAAATTEIYTLSLHDALPIFHKPFKHLAHSRIILKPELSERPCHVARYTGDRKSTRLNSSHTVISYAVFCLKKKKHTHPCTLD